MGRNCSHWGAAAGAAGWSVSPGRGAVGSGRDKQLTTVKEKNFYLHLLVHLFSDRYLKLTVESGGGAGTGVGGRSLARGVRG